VRAGSFDAVIEAATGTGLAENLERGNAESVRALADAARYTERSALAIRSLTVLRTRFPGTHHATAAAFLLGRTFENSHQDEEAKRFYQLYLREAGRGEFAAEALAGKMRMVARLDGADEARPIAQEYLDRYPNGVHAKSVRRLLDAH
jgi:TolA-binding protein